MPVRPSRRRGARFGARSTGGQTTVEFALVLPLLLAFLLALGQVALVARDQVLTVHAARVAAREASVAASPARVRAAATDVLDDASVDVTRGRHVGDDIEVVVHYTSRTSLPLIGELFPDVELEGRAVMRREK